MGLISYLIDPVSNAPAGKGGRSVMVAGSMNDAHKASYAVTEPPPFPISEAHLGFQKKFTGGKSAIGNPAPDRRPLFLYIDRIRNSVINAIAVRSKAPTNPAPRLSLAGLVARLLSFDRYRSSGFTEGLFRQALFTTLLEAHTAPTRRTMDPLDAPLEVTRNAAGKYVWPARYWNFLNIFGSYLDNATLDDMEVEVFAEHAVLLLTFHQAKGLEFDHVYVAGTGRAPDHSPALRTMLFSGLTPRYTVDGSGAVNCSDQQVVRLAEADRDREVYVALTRAQSHLTILHDPAHDWAYLALNPALAALFKGRPATAHPIDPRVKVLEYV
jgi:DNA helicase-2/ATP-dependent DNA helicase PcrA